MRNSIIFSASIISLIATCGEASLKPIIEISMCLKEKQLEQSRNIPWQNYKYKTVPIVYKGCGTGRITTWLGPKYRVDQEVLDFSFISKEEPYMAQQISVLLAQSHTTGNNISEFLETGIWIIQTNNSYYSSHAPFDFSTIDEAYQELLTSKLSQVFDQVIKGGEKELFIKKVIFLHTHPGQGTPLSPGDKIAVDNIAQVMQEYYPNCEVQIYAIPVEDKGNVIFRYRNIGKK